MRHYHFDEDDEKAQEQMESFTETNEADRYMEMIEAGFAQRDLDQQLMAMAIQSAQTSFWWYFKGQRARMKTIYQNYMTLASILVGEGVAVAENPPKP